jgi:hypothetical protein
MTGKIFFRISVVALFTAGAVAHATALSFKDISGKWCSEAGDYDFRPDMLIAKFHDRTPSRRLKVSSYDFRDDKIVMYWSWKGQKLYTEFSEFGADGRTMAQQEGESGPRRVFRRC